MGNFDLQPTLSGELLSLRPLVNTDFEELYKVSYDPQVWSMHPEKNRYQREVFEKFFTAAMESKGAFAAIDKKTNEIIGSSRFSALNFELKQIEIGYTFLAKKYWGKGFNAEMKKLMLTHAFQYVERIVFYIGEDNLRSRHAIEKIGAQFLEKLERQPKEGVNYNAVIYKVDKEDFNK